MDKHPLHDVAVVGVYNTEQARVLEGHTSESITLQAIRGVLDEAGLKPSDIDGVSAGGGGRSGTFGSAHIMYLMGIAPGWRAQGMDAHGISSILEAAGAIATGQCHTVLIAGGSASVYTERGSTAPWTRPGNEFVASWGLFTAAEFALVAQRHMHLYGTKPEQIAKVAAVIRNNGHVNPSAVYFQRGPFTVQDILESRMVADPYHLLDCAMTSEGGSAIILTNSERAGDTKNKPISILGGAKDHYGPSYHYPPAWDLVGWAGREASRKAFGMAGLRPEDVDVCELYDPFSFEIIRQLESYGFCGEGEGGDFVSSGAIERGGRYPITTDGGTMSFSHGGASVQHLQRVIQAVRQLRGTAGNAQVEGAEVALCSGGGAGAFYTDVLLLGSERP